MNLDKKAATMIMHEGWGDTFKFQMEDNHAYYFKSDDFEAKVVKNYEEEEFVSIEGRDHNEEDWQSWDTINYSEVEEMLRKLQLSERHRYKQQELTM